MEVVDPAAQRLVDSLYPLVKGEGSRLSGQPFEFCLQAFPSGFVHYQLISALFPLSISGYEPVAQYLEGYWAANTAFLPVNRQMQFIAQEHENAVAHPFGGGFAAHVDAEIVGVAHVAVSPFLQLFIQLIEQDVGQQGAEGRALRHAFPSLLQLAVDLYRCAQKAADQLERRAAFYPLVDQFQKDVYSSTSGLGILETVHQPSLEYMPT